MQFFSGNSICWRVRPEDEHHTLVCYKQNYVVDPAWNRGEYSELATLCESCVPAPDTDPDSPRSTASSQLGLINHLAVHAL